MTDPVTIIVIALVIFVIVCAIYFLTRKKNNDKVDEIDEIENKKSNLLENRDVVDEPIEISDDMSLAEIKRAKSARVRSKGNTRRATAVEATEASARKHAGAFGNEIDDDDELIDMPDTSAVKVSLSSGNDGPVVLPSAPSRDSKLMTTLSHRAVTKESYDEEKKNEVKKENIILDTIKSDRQSDVSTSSKPENKKKEKAKPDVEKLASKAAREEPEARSLEEGLAKTRSGFIEKLGGLFKKDKLDDDLVNEVEEILYTADIGPKAASRIMEAIEKELHKDAKQDPKAVWSFVRTYVKDLLSKRQDPIDTTASKPYVFLMIGVNGVGKTTTIGKLASKFRQEGKSVLMVAGDTFRAAAVEQLEVWGVRTGIEVYKGASEQDPASVIYEGIEKAVKDGTDIVICDTAGRLQSNTNLLDELAKIGRVANKVVEGAPHETLLVLDANTGQNALLQARKFNEAVNISGIVLTKLDGTAKGGIILGICDEISAPIRYIGIGEAVEDLRPFNADEFVEALFM